MASKSLIREGRADVSPVAARPEQVDTGQLCPPRAGGMEAGGQRVQGRG